MDSRELTYMTSHWWELTMQGILAILFGIACVFWPGLTLVTFVYLFGLYILVTGVIGVFSGLFSMGRGSSWILTLVLGLIELGIGVYLLRNPHVSFALLILLVGSSLVVYGVFGVVAALSSKDTTSNGRMLSLIGGGLATLAGIVMFFQPASSGVAFVWIVGLYALLTGPLWIAMSMEVKGVHEGLTATRR